MGASTTLQCVTSQRKLHSRFLEGVRNVPSLCLQIGYPTVASVPHSVINGYKWVLALSVETDYTFPLAEKVQRTHRDHSKNIVVLPSWIPKSMLKSVI